MRVAVVDIGTNSTRLLVADVEDGAVEELERRTDVTRLGEGVDRNGRLSERAMERVMAACSRYRELVDRRGAKRVLAVMTSAVRDATNGPQFQELLRARFGFDARTISGDREARLTYLGATSWREHDRTLLVLDIGGGSTEFVIGTGTELEFHISTQIGSVRFTERHLRSDPPTADELTECRRQARGEIERAIPADLRERTRECVAVAGTPTSFAAIDQRLDPYDRDRVHGYVLSAERCERILTELAALPVGERRGLIGLHPDRAPTIVAGGVILTETIGALDLAAVEVSERDILDGAALAAVREDA